MPKRTTPLQAVIHMVRSHFAGDGILVTESKVYRDRSFDTDREVDIVVEGYFDGDNVITSIEVIQQSRKGGLQWAEGLIKKHETLPTNLLILVAPLGFTSGALKAVEAQGGWVRAVQPEVITQEDGSAYVRSLYADSISLTPTQCLIEFALLSGAPTAWDVSAGDVVYDNSEVELGTVWQLVCEILKLPWVAKHYLVSAHTDPSRDELTHFSCGFEVGGLFYFIKTDSVPLLITKIEIVGQFSFRQEEMRFTSSKLDGRQYESGHGTLFDKLSAWVRFEDAESGAATVKLRSLDGRHGTMEGPGASLRFPAILNISPLIEADAQNDG